MNFRVTVPRQLFIHMHNLLYSHVATLLFANSNTQQIVAVKLAFGKQVVMHSVKH